MYNPDVTAKRMENLTKVLRRGIDPKFEFKEYSFKEIDDFCSQLEKCFDSENQVIIRGLNDPQADFVRHELNRCKVDFLYWLTRYCKIKNKHAELVRVRPTHVQSLFLDRVALAEKSAVLEHSGDGILFAVLKARQLGISTITECIIAHRIFFYGNITGLIASDVEDHTINLYEMVARIIDNSPWWLRPRSADPEKDYRAKNKIISFADQDSVLRFSNGKNMQGGRDQEKGSIGTGQTIHLGHVSEFALWANAEQIYDSLLPAVPMSPKTFFVIESTAKGRGNEWQRTWDRAKAGLGRLKPVFFPYYTDPADYRMPAPANWAPKDFTLAHAERIYQTSPQWVGKNVTLTREQMFWYEQKYEEYKDSKMLYKFRAEYCCDDLEAFQASSQGVFPGELLDDLRNKAVKEPVLAEIRPRSFVQRA